MRVQQHLEKAQQFERTIQRLDWDHDYELAIWSHMHAATQYLNAALHSLGITKEKDEYPASKLNQFLVPVPGPAGVEWREEFGAPGDILHTNMPGMPPPQREDIASAYEALALIESLGPRFVRGAEGYSPQEGERCREALETVKTISLKALGAGAPR